MQAPFLLESNSENNKTKAAKKTHSRYDCLKIRSLNVDLCQCEEIWGRQIRSRNVNIIALHIKMPNLVDFYFIKTIVLLKELDQDEKWKNNANPRIVFTCLH